MDVSVPSRAIRAGHAWRATSSPTQAGQAATARHPRCGAEAARARPGSDRRPAPLTPPPTGPASPRAGGPARRQHRRARRGDERLPAAARRGRRGSCGGRGRAPRARRRAGGAAARGPVGDRSASPSSSGRRRAAARPASRRCGGRGRRRRSRRRRDGARARSRHGRDRGRGGGQPLGRRRLAVVPERPAPSPNSSGALRTPARAPRGPRPGRDELRAERGDALAPRRERLAAEARCDPPQGGIALGDRGAVLGGQRARAARGGRGRGRSTRGGRRAGP